MANPASPPDTPSHRSLAAPERTAPFSARHIGPDAEELSTVLSPLGFGSRDELIDTALPGSLRDLRGLRQRGLRGLREIDKAGDAVGPNDHTPQVDAPHTAQMPAREGERPYSRNTAAYPLTTAGRNNYWPPVRRVDGAHGDRNLVCSCPAIDADEA